MKKLITAFLILTCALCMCSFAACQNGTYYDITFEKVSGITYNCEIKSGATVLNGYKVEFSLDVDDEVVGEPKVLKNGEELKPDKDGKYSFVMKENTDIEIDGAFKQKYYSVIFDDQSGWIDFTCTSGHEDLTKIKAGDVFSFEVALSVYYVQQEYDVLANSEVLTEKDGAYSFTIVGDTTISIDNLKQVVNFTEREDGGLGTAADPFKIREPIDLFYMSQLVNSEEYANYGYYGAYYELMNDIDMQGEQLFVIGDMTSESAFFAGTFNGNGHTISNYVIKDTAYINGVETFLPYLGLFGYAAAVQGKSPEIYNLNLDNFSINIDASSRESMFAVGGVVGAGIGANVIACNVTNATITADADYGFFGYAGGILGIHQSAYDTDSTMYYATVVSCSSDVYLSAGTGYAYAFGGIAGYMISYEERATALILNSYSSSQISGAIYSGGIVGKADNNTSIIGCYSTGDVSAQSRISDSQSEEYATAYAGGIAGYIDYNSVISDCFVTGEVNAASKNNNKKANFLIGETGNYYEFAGEIAGAVGQAGQVEINARETLVLNCYGKSSKVTFNNDFYKNTLMWANEDWSFGEGMPTANLEATSKTFAVTINYAANVNGEKQKTVSITDMYIPMSYWNIALEGMTQNAMIPEFVTADNGNRSYGYFFDENLTQQVPYAFVPTRDITLYVGFANYGNVADKYYIQAPKKGSGAYVELTSDGKLYFVNGASKLESTYVYNGKEVILLNTAIATLGGFENLTYNDGTTLKDYANEYYYNYKATVNDAGVMKIWDVLFYIENKNELGAVRPNDAFNYGVYYDDNNNEYVFNLDGTGYVEGASSEEFTFTVSGDKVLIKRNLGEVEYALVNGEISTWGSRKITPYDAFKGVWETKANAREVYEFDGKGNYTYNGATSGTYTLNGLVLTTDDGKTFTLENGFITATTSKLIDGKDVSINKELYKENSFAGTWYFNSKRDQMKITFDGITVDGLGTATLTNTKKTYEYELTYESVVNGDKVFVNVYDGSFVFATLTYNSEANTLVGLVYASIDGRYIEGAIFCLYDNMQGEWIAKGAISSIQFNGLGGYNVKADSSNYLTNGRIRIVTSDSKTKNINYTFDFSTQRAIFSYNNKDYYAEYDEYTDTVSLTVLGETTSVVFKHYDGWQDIVLVSADGVRYEFDGRGDLPEGGTLTIIDGDNKNEFGYNNVSDGILIKQNKQQNRSKIKIGSDGFYVDTFDDASKNVKLYVASSYTGEWLINRNDGEISVGNVNASMQATGKYKDDDVTFTFEDDYAYFKYDGKIIYVYIVTVGNEDVLILAEGLSNYTSTICIRNGAQDEWYGEYTSADGTKKIYFDGLGSSAAYNGTVQIKTANGVVEKLYDYSIKNGVVEIKASNSEKYLLKACEETANGAYLIKGKYYRLARIDYLYNAYATEESTGNVYTFDGLGYDDLGVVTVTDKDGKKIGDFSYKYESASSASYTITVTIYDTENPEGKKAEIYYALGLGHYTLTFQAEESEG